MCQYNTKIVLLLMCSNLISIEVFIIELCVEIEKKPFFECKYKQDKYWKLKM